MEVSTNPKTADVELPRGYCWEYCSYGLFNGRKTKSPWHRFKCKGVEPRIVEFSVLGSTPVPKSNVAQDHFGGYGKPILGIPLIDVQDGTHGCIPRV